MRVALSRSSIPSDVLSLFTFLWAQVMVLQVVKLSIRFMSLPASFEVVDATLDFFWLVMMALACFVGIAFPRQAWATLFLTSVSCLVLWFTGSQSNHVFMDMVISLSVLLTYSSDRNRWLAQSTDAMISFLIALYIITALHKLNTDWNDVRYSCSTLMLAGVLSLPMLRWTLPIVPWTLTPALATLTELGLPILLWSGYCDRITTCIGCAFHVVLCQMLPPMSVYPFSLLMAPAYVFVIPDLAPIMFDRLRPWAVLIVLLYAATCGTWTSLMTGGSSRDEDFFEYPPYGFWAPGVVWCNLINAILITAAMWPGSCEKRAPAPARTLLGRLPAFSVVIFGLSPYLGIRNHPALAMFSNLRVEGGRSNHAFIRDDFDFFGWQRDYVTIHSTNIPALRFGQVDLAPLFTSATREALTQVGIEHEFWIAPPLKAWPYPETRAFKPYSMPFIELRRRVAPLKSLGGTGNLRYTRTIAKAHLLLPWLWDILGIRNPSEDDVRANLTYDLSAGDEELEEPLLWWQALFFRFRSFDVDYSPCRH